MEGILTDKLLQEPAVNLCFHKDVFMRENFSVDTFVSEHRKCASLEKLRDDLNVHLKFLRSSMIKLINKDYADFVNLSANLVGLDKFIRNISKPLEDLKQEVNEANAAFEAALTQARTELAARRAVQEKKALLQQAIAVSKSVDKIERLLPSPDHMDRWTNEQVEQVAIEVNQVLFYLSKCKQVKLAGALAERVNAVTELLQRHLEDSFLRGLKIDSQPELSSVLRICATLDRVEAVEELFRKRIVAPALDEMVTDKVVQEVGLDGIYNQVMMFLSTRCQTLLDLTLGAARFQEIACQLEAAIIQPSQRSKGDEFLLLCHETLWDALRRCWDEDVFLPPLSHRFWKLTLQLLARHRGWLHQYATRSGVGEEATSGPEAGDGEDGGSCDASIDLANPQGPVLFVMLHCDVQNVASKLGSLLTDTVQPRLQQTGFTEFQLLKEGLDECSQLLVNLGPSISARLVSDVTKACCVQLKMVPDIPRLYRRTNREVPSKPSSYVQQILLPLATLKDQSSQNPNLNWDLDWTVSVLEEVTKQYMTVTKDVLVSVKKMEDSLKRLKRARDRTPLPEGAASDDDKIRLQLYIDVEHFGVKMEELGTPKSKVPSYGALVEIVEAARSSPRL
ncbi:conserved oligomeric Golgi complex subunit 2 isoform X2 [Dermacentor andersoni]|uniref:conserved oligomeric Golgi complex subunit 2 isoform X2 n=1 Tax=Dermacentor andersoni TaxID=34620 RepID=UPI00241742D3|nr:conserved oligomeric Golgi complex subunit 2-like isoform X2 [Dermacentor andersoni]